MKYFFIISCLLATLKVKAQTDPSKLTISGYLEAYYLYDFEQPENHTRPGFIYSHNRTNEVNLNLAYIKANYQHERVRANLAIGAGTYMNANMAAEPGVLKNLFEATIGVRLSKKHELWLDAGLLPSHIGFESAIGKDNSTLTRSIMADNSPYYEAGVKLSYTSKNTKWQLSALVLNGWQRIQRPDSNHTIGLGHQITFKPTPSITLNSSSFIGNDKPSERRQFRYFHNFYGIWKLNPKLELITAFDIGAEQKEKGSKAMNSWLSSAIIASYKAANKWKMAARAEYYEDRNGVIIPKETPSGFQTWGYSVNIDYLPIDNLIWRLEGRKFQGTENNYFITSSIALSF